MSDSAEPSVVFTGLARVCVPDWCEGFIVDIAEGEAQYRICSPNLSAGLAWLSEARAVRVNFQSPADDGDRFTGVATFWWRQARLTAREESTAALLVDHAVQTIVRQQAEDAAAALASRAEHLQIALESNRRIGVAIGILMSRLKITDEQAIALLRTRSQNTHLKLRTVADDVIATGWLDPSLTPAPRMRRRGTPGSGLPHSGAAAVPTTQNHMQLPGPASRTKRSVMTDPPENDDSSATADESDAPADVGPEPTQTEHPTGDDQAARNRDEEPPG